MLYHVMVRRTDGTLYEALATEKLSIAREGVALARGIITTISAWIEKR